MKLHRLEFNEVVPIDLDTAWDFFSSPKNLGEITPAEMNFKVLSDLGDGKMYPGQIIHYIVHPMLGIPMRWTTEITHVEHHSYFVDEQRFGPYAMWHHEHFFKAVEGGVEVRDLLHYAMPFGPIGNIANSLFVTKKVKNIFEFRSGRMKELFGSV